VELQQIFFYQIYSLYKRGFIPHLHILLKYQMWFNRYVGVFPIRRNPFRRNPIRRNPFRRNPIRRNQFRRNPIRRN